MPWYIHSKGEWETFHKTLLWILFCFLVSQPKNHHLYSCASVDGSTLAKKITLALRSNKVTCPFNSVFMQKNVYPSRVKIYITSRLNARPWVYKMVFAIRTSNGNRFRVAFFCKSSNRQFNVHTIPPPSFSADKSCDTIYSL